MVLSLGSTLINPLYWFYCPRGVLYQAGTRHIYGQAGTTCQDMPRHQDDIGQNVKLVDRSWDEMYMYVCLPVCLRDRLFNHQAPGVIRSKLWNSGLNVYIKPEFVTLLCRLHLKSCILAILTYVIEFLRNILIDKLYLRRWWWSL